jgi:hypothetical protein
MINIDNIYRMKDSNVITIYNILKKRIESGTLRPEVEAIFIVNMDILAAELELRGISA